MCVYRYYRMGDPGEYIGVYTRYRDENNYEMYYIKLENVEIKVNKDESGDYPLIVQTNEIHVNNKGVTLPGNFFFHRFEDGQNDYYYYVPKSHYDKHIKTTAPDIKESTKRKKLVNRSRGFTGEMMDGMMNSIIRYGESMGRQSTNRNEHLTRRALMKPKSKSKSKPMSSRSMKSTKSKPQSKSKSRKLYEGKRGGLYYCKMRDGKKVKVYVR